MPSGSDPKDNACKKGFTYKNNACKGFTYNNNA